MKEAERRPGRLVLHRALDNEENELDGRWGTPEDLRGIVVFLASPASDYINGYTIAVDAGWLAR